MHRPKAHLRGGRIHPTRRRQVHHLEVLPALAISAVQRLLVLQCGKLLSVRRQERVEKRLLHVARTDDPSGDAVDGSVEESQARSALCPARRSAPARLAISLSSSSRRTTWSAVPAHGTGYMQWNTVEMAQHGGNLIADDFRGMVVAAVHQVVNAFVRGGIAQGRIPTNRPCRPPRRCRTPCSPRNRSRRPVFPQIFRLSSFCRVFPRRTGGRREHP